MKVTPRVLFALLIVLALTVAACGGSPDTVVEDEPTTAPDNPAPTATSEPAPTATEMPPPPTATVEGEPTAEIEPTPEGEGGEEGESGEEGEEGGESDASDDASEPETVSAGDPEAGEEHFQQVCSACHGPDATGIEGLGKDLTTSEFVAGLSDAELLAFIQEGRPVDHPDNTTGVAMPPRGGNPDFSDDQLMDIIAFIRTLHVE